MDERFLMNEDCPSLEEQFDSIMRNFDFDKVLDYMKWDKSHREYDDYGHCIKTGPWKVFIQPNEFRIPTCGELIESAAKLLRGVMAVYKNQPENFISMHTGPFKVICRYGVLELIACLEYWSYD